MNLAPENMWDSLKAFPDNTSNLKREKHHRPHLCRKLVSHVTLVHCYFCHNVYVQINFKKWLVENSKSPDWNNQFVVKEYVVTKLG